MLAKSVAQISVEMKSIKSIEEIVNNLMKDVHDLKQQINTANIINNNDNLELISNPSVPFSPSRSMLSTMPLESVNNRSLSEPNINTRVAGENRIVELSDHQKISQSSLNNQSKNNKSETLIYTNPKKLQKLKKFFGQEPPMLKLFLMKLDYEVMILLILQKEFGII
jgi:hypothetical protein